MAAFSRHAVKYRDRIRRRPGADMGGVIAAGSEAERTAGRVLTPRAWFWHKVEIPVLAEAENGTLTENDRTRRVRGRELADVLCGLEGGGERAVAAGAGTRVVRLLCSVFDLAGSDLATVARAGWRHGAPADVAARVVRDVGQALRCMHGCGIAHGDVKLANILRMGDGYWLGDLPAVTRATTKMLTNDPLASTALAAGKRLLCNDMWGLGIVTLGLLAGVSPFKHTCDRFKRVLPPLARGG